MASPSIRAAWTWHRITGLLLKEALGVADTALYANFHPVKHDDRESGHNSLVLCPIQPAPALDAGPKLGSNLLQQNVTHKL